MGTLQNLMWMVLCAGICAAKRPNIVFMIADDLGWSDVSFHGSRQIPTPNLDAIARDGIILNQYYVQPLCSPSRGCLMTGKYAIRIGFQHFLISANEPWGLPLKEKILPQYLKSLDYATHAVGKWHLGFFKDEYTPLQRGFDSFFGYYTGMKDYFTHFANEGNITGLDLHNMYQNAWQYNGTYGADLFTNKAVKVIKEHNKRKPLFLYLAQQAPHSGNFATQPLQAPDKYVRPLAGIADEDRRIFAGMVSSMDRSVGEVFAALEKRGMLGNTLFIFTSDNGGSVGNLNGVPASNYPLRGGKLTLWEGGVRAVACIWSSRLRRQSRIYNNLMHITDWLPTLLSAAGGLAALEMLGNVDGVDHWPSLVQHHPPPRSEILLNIDNVEGVEAIRRGKFKLVKGSAANGALDGWYDVNGNLIMGAPPVQLHEERNMYEETYLRFLLRSKVVEILWRKYGRQPRLTVSCQTPACKEQLEVNCFFPRPGGNTCNKKGPCLFDVSEDPCEFYDISHIIPEMTASLEQALDKYRSCIVPAGNKPADQLADPKLHENAWVPWK